MLYFLYLEEVGINIISKCIIITIIIIIIIIIMIMTLIDQSI